VQLPVARDEPAGQAGIALPHTFATMPYQEIWAVDFEFMAGPGEDPDPICLVAWELRSGRRVRLWRHEFGLAPPYSTGADTLFVAY